MSLTQFALLSAALIVVAVVAYQRGRQAAVATDRSRKVAAPAAPAVVGGSRPERSEADGATPVRIESWGYQLQHLDVGRLAASPFDVLVVDYSKDGSDDGAFTPQDLVRLKRKPDGRRRIMLAYLSIGEAESYRGYWRAEWAARKPDWLLTENPDWDENYAVCFWDPAWQSLMYRSPKARLDLILAAGFDGVYLDKCDVFDDMRARGMPAAATRADLEADMIAFVTRLSAYAKAQRPDFLVYMQNTESLLERATLRDVLDGVGKEELVYGVDKSRELDRLHAPPMIA